MTHLSRGDLRAVLRLAGDLADVESRSQALGQIGPVSSVLKADTAVVGEVSVAPDGAAVVEAYDEPHGWFDGPARAALAQYADEHPLVLSDNGPPPPVGAHKVSDFVDARSWRRRAVYNDVYRPMGLRWELVAPIRVSTEEACCLAFQRGGGDFSERERELLDLIAPHFKAALERGAVARQADALALALKRGGEQLVTVGANGRLLEAGAGARETIRAWFPDHSAAAELPTAVAAWRTRTRHAAAPAPYAVARGEARLTVRLVPGEQEDLLLLAVRARHSPDAAQLAEALPISRREAEVLARVAAGEQNAGIAHALGISPFTVARHVEALYRKLDVHSRAEATVAAIGAVAA